MTDRGANGEANRITDIVTDRRSLEVSQQIQISSTISGAEGPWWVVSAGRGAAMNVAFPRSIQCQLLALMGWSYAAPIQLPSLRAYWNVS
jgi:hypothetical protein